MHGSGGPAGDVAAGRGALTIMDGAAAGAAEGARRVHLTFALRLYRAGVLEARRCETEPEQEVSQLVSPTEARAPPFRAPRAWQCAADFYRGSHEGAQRDIRGRPAPQCHRPAQRLARRFRQPAPLPQPRAARAYASTRACRAWRARRSSNV